MSVGSSPPWERLSQREEGTFDPGFWVSTTILAGVPAAPLRRSTTFLMARTTKGRRRSKRMVFIVDLERLTKESIQNFFDNIKGICLLSWFGDLLKGS